MQLKQKQTVRHKIHTFTFAANAVSYRIPRQVVRMRVLQNGFSYPLCPRCNISVDREYMTFCDRCGQRLSWNRYPNVCILPAGK